MMPNFFIVGAARSGTTSLDRYLSQHPEIYITPKKETHFFASDFLPCTGPGDKGLNGKVLCDEAQYMRLFDGAVGKKAVGESSVFYLPFSAAAERIAQAIPDAKIIILLREPISRAYSAYMHLVRDGREHLDFVEGLNQEEVRRQKGFEPMWWYKELGLYYKQVKRYLDVFGVHQVKIVLYDELCANPQQLLRNTFRFLGVREDVIIDTSVYHNIAGVPRSRLLYTLLNNFMTQPNAVERFIKSLIPSRSRMVLANKAMSVLLQAIPINPDVHASLKPYFSKDIELLEDMLRRDLRCWREVLPETTKNVGREAVVQGSGS